MIPRALPRVIAVIGCLVPLLTSADGTAGAVRWRYGSSRPMLAAVTTTASGLVITGELTGISSCWTVATAACWPGSTRVCRCTRAS